MNRSPRYARPSPRGRKGSRQRARQVWAIVAMGLCLGTGAFGIGLRDRNAPCRGSGCCIGGHGQRDLYRLGSLHAALGQCLPAAPVRQSKRAVHRQRLCRLRSRRLSRRRDAQAMVGGARAGHQFRLPRALISATFPSGRHRNLPVVGFSLNSRTGGNATVRFGATIQRSR